VSTPHVGHRRWELPPVVVRPDEVVVQRVLGGATRAEAGAEAVVQAGQELHHDFFSWVWVLIMTRVYSAKNRDAL